MSGISKLQNQGLITNKDSLAVNFELGSEVKAKGVLHIIWTDSYGRTVSDQTTSVEVDGSSIGLTIPLERAVAMLNYLEARLEVGKSVIAAPKTEFIVTPEPHKLDDYSIIMYYPYKPHQQEALRKLGINAGQIQPKNKISTAEADQGRIWYQHNYRFYCDQIAVPYYAAYHSPMYEQKQKLLLDAKELYKKDRTSKEAFIRHPGFHDEEATKKALYQITKTVEEQKRFKPLMYTTDECGVADLVSAWDFDFSPEALTAMRKWLLEQYGSLEEINKEWGTDYNTLDEVAPYTTDEMMEKGDYNLSPWADHRHFMNKAFTDAVSKGTEAAHKADSDAKSGIVGCQMPSAFGGYDYWLLSRVVDIVEPYNIGNNREIWRSFAPGKPAFTTFFRYSGFEIWRLWHQALHGDRGIIIYDENSSYLDNDTINPTELGSNLTPSYKELTSGIVRQLAYGKPDSSQVAIHYSQASITAHWMFDVVPAGKDWINRGSAIERLDSEFLRLRESVTKLIEDNLTDYDFIAYEQLENGEFASMDKKLLILPQSVAMSQKEAEAVRNFAEKGGVVVADYRLALMDSHCKQLDNGQLDEFFGICRSSMQPAPGAPGVDPITALSSAYSWAQPLIATGSIENVQTAEPTVKPADNAAALFHDKNGTPAVIVKNQGRGKTIYLNLHLTDYHRWRLKKSEGTGILKLMSQIFRIADVNKPIHVKAQDGEAPTGLELFTWNYGSMKIAAFHRNYQNRVSELGPPEYQDQSRLEADMVLTAGLGGEYYVYETRSGKYLGRSNNISFTMDKWEPKLFTMFEQPITGLTLKAPGKASKGNMYSAEISLHTKAPGDFHVFRCVVEDPCGNELELHSKNILAPAGKAVWQFPFAQSDTTGAYTLVVKDVATGLTAEHKLILE